MALRNSADRIRRLEFDADWRPGHVASYLVDGPEPILVDAGLPDSEAELHDALGELGHEVADVEHLLITHPHVDHVGQVPTVLEAGDPTLYAPASVQERLTGDPEALGERVREHCEKAGFPEEQMAEAVDAAVGSLERNAELLPPESVDVWIDPDETTSVGHLDVDPIFTPGHQADHLCYRADVDGESVLLAGDMGIEPFRPVIVNDGLDDGHREAFDDFLESLDRLEPLDVDQVYPGHGPVHDDLESAVIRDRESIHHRLDTVRDLVSEGNSTALEVVWAIAGDRDVRYIVPEAMGALAYLERHGEVDTEYRDGVRHYVT
jgi:glyoxylase-like metal-dependent hydrolase (beta-lactamase superfamily II)